jgi:hypothetical protein
MARSTEVRDQAARDSDSEHPLSWMIAALFLAFILGLAGLVALKLWVLIRMLLG